MKAINKKYMDFSRVRNYLFLFSLATVTLLFLYVIEPFIYPIFWAAVIATLFYPVYSNFQKFFNKRYPGTSSLLTILLVVAVIVLPLMLIATLVVRETISIYESLNQGQLNKLLQDLASFLQNNQLLDRFNIDESMISQQLNDFGRNSVAFIFETTKSFTQNSLKFFALFVLMLYTLFFFFRDGEKMLYKLLHVFPLGDKYEKMLYEKFTSTTSATIKGTLVVGGVQGLLGGILFWITGVPSPLILGIVMTLLSIIPAAGSFIVWLPTAIIMLLVGKTWEGIVILVVGSLLISTIDNFLRPMLVGKDLQMHPVVILFSTLGGIAIFGISGFIIGPIIAALFQSFWEIYEHYYKNELSKN